jgi:glycosyltransferase involved in cell wall biosynthesis
METSFPSKMLEMAQFGKPLVIWGPEYCSAVQWARQGNRALCVTDQNPDALRHALEKLAVSTDEQQRLAAAALQSAQTDFNPDRIQAQFMDALRSVIRLQPN